MAKTIQKLPIYVQCVVALVFSFLSSPVAISGEGSAKTPECKEITARIVEQTNTHFDHFSPSGGSVFFRKPDMVLICDSHFITYVSLNWDASASPPNDWFALAAAAGNAVTSVDPRRLEAAARKCHRTALSNKSEIAGLELSGAKIECQAFTRGGGGVIVEVVQRKN